MWDIVAFLRTALVGETFAYGSLLLTVRESVPGEGCAGCHFFNENRQCKLLGACMAHLRRDGRSVIFVEDPGQAKAKAEAKAEAEAEAKAKAKARMVAESRIRLEGEGAEWSDVPGYEGLYRVSDDGRVMSVGRAVKYDGSPRVVPRTARMMKLYQFPSGSRWVSLWDGWEHRSFRVRELVARAFIPNPDGLGRVKHLNGNLADNRAGNLAWAEAAVKPGGG